MADQKKRPRTEIVTVGYMGRDYEVDKTALLSMKYQRLLACGSRDQAAMYDAMDVILCGKLAECEQTIPEEDGSVGEYGASVDAMAAFFGAITEQVSPAKK